MLPSLHTLDLTQIRLRLKLAHRWSRRRIIKAHAGYLDFLRVFQLDPQATVRPSEDVDVVWHEHVLDTEKYAADCQNFLGFFLHHKPDPVTEDSTRCTCCGGSRAEPPPVGETAVTGI
jgi:hypothetical protein